MAVLEGDGSATAMAGMAAGRAARVVEGRRVVLTSRTRTTLVSCEEAVLLVRSGKALIARLNIPRSRLSQRFTWSWMARSSTDRNVV